MTHSCALKNRKPTPVSSGAFLPSLSLVSSSLTMTSRSLLTPAPFASRVFSHPRAPFALHSRRQPTHALPNLGSGGGPEDYTRREFILQSVNWAILGDLVGTDDAKTIVNSILGAYGLPQLKASRGYKIYDQFEDDFYFEYPKSWVVRPNSQRAGVYISDFNTADKLTVEVFSQEEAGASLEAAVVSKLIDPANQVGGDSKLFGPAQGRIKSEERVIDGQKYLYVAFPSETITRSGYQVRRKNVAVAAVRRGNVYCLGASSRSDQMNAEKAELLQHIVDSFRLR